MATFQEKTKETRILVILNTFTRLEKRSLKQCTFGSQRPSFDKVFVFVLRQRTLKQCTLELLIGTFVQELLRTDPCDSVVLSAAPPGVFTLVVKKHPWNSVLMDARETVLLKTRAYRALQQDEDSRTYTKCFIKNKKRRSVSILSVCTRTWRFGPSEEAYTVQAVRVYLPT